jgi:prepilin-type N-terminal cleavage/methylation domain-containing protein
MSVHRTQQGFTLIELMVVVAVIGILAALAVTYFGRTQKNTKARAEVSAMFAEMKVKQEQAMLELGDYQDCGTAGTEADFFPTTVAGNGNKTAVGALPAAWVALGISPATGGLLCQYVCVHGAPGANATVGALASAEFGFGGATPVPPADPWYYLLAHCDMDSNPALDSYYFQNSSDNGFFYTNQGN